MKNELYEKELPENINWEIQYDFEVSDLITTARLHSGYTQSQLAKAIGTQQPSIARAENGASLASHGMLKKIASAIHTTLIPPKFAFMERPNVVFMLLSGQTFDQQRFYAHASVVQTNETGVFNAPFVPAEHGVTGYTVVSNGRGNIKSELITA